jgi:hypothetical protein
MFHISAAETKEKFRHANFKSVSVLTFGYHPKQHEKQDSTNHVWINIYSKLTLVTVNQQKK